MSDKLAKTEEKTMIQAARTSGDILAQKKIVKDAMENVMKDGIHYGKIPGCGPKPALLKPGIEALTSTFRLALTHSTEDLSTDDCVRYRVKTTVVYSPTGLVLGDALGECSSDEKKYKWRAPVCEEEWEDAPPDRRREVWKKGWKDSPPTKDKQVRTDPADIANTVLKMATKRADAGAVLLALGVSDIFNQDIEEWTPEMIAALSGDEDKIKQPQAKAKPVKEKKKAKPKAKAKPKPAPKPEPEPEEEEEEAEAEEVEAELVDEDEDSDLVGYITNARIATSGTSAAGRKWTLYKIAINEEEFATFDDDLAKLAYELRDSNARVIFEYEDTDKGPKLTSLRADTDDDGEVPF